jgi:hypothetical protein
MELVYCSERIERKTKSTCREIKEKIINLERTIDILQEKRKELMKNKKLELPPAGLPAGMRPVINNNSMINWQGSLRH